MDVVTPGSQWYRIMLYHGTKDERVPNILIRGLDVRYSARGAREDVHMTDDKGAIERGEVKSGVREGSTAIVELDGARMIADGFEVRRSDNSATNLATLRASSPKGISI